MVPSSFIISIFLLLQAIAAEQVSQEQCYLEDRPDSTLKCWGDDIETREALKIPDGVSLARFCRRSQVLMECGRGTTPNYPIFLNVASIKEGNVPIYNPSPYQQLWAGDTLQPLYHTAMLLCSEKCVCNDQAPDSKLTPPVSNSCDYSFLITEGAAPGPVPPFTVALVYNFDTGDVRTTKVQPTDKFKEVLGPAVNQLDAIHYFKRGGWRPLPQDVDIYFGDPAEAPYRLRRMQYVGDPNNKPVCNVLGPGETTLEDDVGPYVMNFLTELWGGPLPDAQQLCAHTFYGGYDRRNLGAVCKLGPNRKPVLSIEWSRVSPQFLPEYHTWRLLSFAALPFVEAFCSASCTCAGEDEEEAQGRKSFFEALQVGAAVPDTGTFLPGSGGQVASAAASAQLPAATASGVAMSGLAAELQAEAPILVERIRAGGNGNNVPIPGLQRQNAMPLPQTFEIEGAPGPSRNRACASNRDCDNNQVCLATTRSTLRDIGSAIISVFLCCVVRDAVDVNNGKPRGQGG